MTRKTLIFSSLTGGKLTGHMILDDVFWIKYFKSQGIEADIITSAYSKANLQKLFPSHQGAINTFEGQPDDDFAGRSKLIRKVFASPRVRNSLVVIQGFEELSILVFLIKNLGGNNQYVLVPTNNIAKGRITGKGRLLRWLLKAIFLLVDKVFCHTQFEITLINRLIHFSDEKKLEVVKYHQGVNRERSAASLSNRPILSFFGPAKPDKTLQPLVDLVLADKKGIWDYRVYNPGDYQAELLSTIEDKANVQVIKHWMNSEEYETAVCQSSYILLSQNRDYEGKLSGNLCDCIAYSIPFISTNISPVNEYVTKYGELGFICDFDQPQWAEKLFSSDPLIKMTEHIEAMKKMRADYTEQCLIEELNEKLPSTITY